MPSGRPRSIMRVLADGVAEGRNRGVKVSDFVSENGDEAPAEGAEGAKEAEPAAAEPAPDAEAAPEAAAEAPAADEAPAAEEATASEAAE